MTSTLTDKERLDAQERAIQMIAHFLDTSDDDFKAYVHERIGSWGDTSEANQTISDADKAATRAFHEEIIKLLRPGKNTLG